MLCRLCLELVGDHLPELQVKTVEQQSYWTIFIVYYVHSLLVASVYNGGSPTAMERISLFKSLSLRANNAFFASSRKSMYCTGRSNCQSSSKQLTNENILTTSNHTYCTSQDPRLYCSILKYFRPLCRQGTSAINKLRIKKVLLFEVLNHSITRIAAHYLIYLPSWKYFSTFYLQIHS